MTESGQWKMNDRGRITAVFPSGKLRFQPGSKGMEIPDIHGHSYHKEHEKFILRKSSAKDSTYFTGNWALEGYNGKGYRQIMKIHGETANDIMVSISFFRCQKRMPVQRQGSPFRRTNHNSPEKHGSRHERNDHHQTGR